MSVVPIAIVLHCPRCGMQHVDAPEPEKGWTNPPHRSHLCAACDFIWRPADVPTCGVRRAKTAGASDTPVLPTVYFLRPESRSTHRERLYVFECNPPGSGSLLLVYCRSPNEVGPDWANVINGAWHLDIDENWKSDRAVLLGYLEVQEGYSDRLADEESEYSALLDHFKQEVSK